MSHRFFWLTKEQLAKIKPHLPTDTRGVARVDDRRVISRIIHVLKSGGRWPDAPRDQYGPRKAFGAICFTRSAKPAARRRRF
jgi:transposase